MTGPMEYEEIEAVVREGEREEKRKRRQFGLRKLLLWTAVAAVLLGSLRMLGVGPLWLAGIASWVVAVGGVRLAWGSPVAFVFSIIGGGIAAAGVVLALLLWRGGLAGAYGGLVWAAVLGALAGYASYLVLESLFSLIGLPEGLLRAEGYDRQGPL